ncbi:hypothetical protein DFH11DRAFT_1731478 [Phellopilus nigrolimitatus]|nr:hypothetical protein DFH11DRAFT_1731478 [Phellopilus nigrolimitatus]
MTDATPLLLSNKLTVILRFFLLKNMRIVCDRAWEHTARSCGKGPESWGSGGVRRPPVRQGLALGVLSQRVLWAVSYYKRPHYYC